MIYLLVLILLLVPVIKYDLLARSDGRENIWYFSLLAVLVLVAGLRYRVGGDTLVYMSAFDGWPSLGELKYFDFDRAEFNPLWYILVALSKGINNSFTCFQIVHALIVNISFFHFFRKYCPRYYFSAILIYFFGYYCYFNMEIMREIMCICMLLWSVDLLLNKRYLWYYVVCAIAFEMHFSSIMMLFLPFAFWVFRKPSWILQIVIFFTIIFLFVIVNVPALLLSLFASNDRIVHGLLGDYMEASLNLGGILGNIFKYLPYLGIIWLRERNDIQDEYDFVPLISCAVIFYAMAIPMSEVVRFANYLVPFFIVSMVNTLYGVWQNYEFKIRQVSWVVTLAVLFTAFVSHSYYYFRDESDFYPGARFYYVFVPYHSVLNPVVDERRESFLENYRGDFFIFF